MEPYNKYYNNNHNHKIKMYFLLRDSNAFRPKRSKVMRVYMQVKEPMPLKSHFSYCLLNNIGQNKFVTCGKFEIYAVCLLYAIANERKKAEEMSQSG